MLRIQGGTPISRRNQHKPNDPHRKRPPCPQCLQQTGADHLRPPGPSWPHAGHISTPAPQLRNPNTGPERVFASKQSISQTRKLRRGVSSRFTPPLSGRAGPKPRRLHRGRRPRLGEVLSFLCCWTELNPAPQRPRSPPPTLASRTPCPRLRGPEPAQGRGQGWELRGRTLHGSSPALPPWSLLLWEKEGVGRLCSKDATQITFPDCHCGDSP